VTLDRWVNYNFQHGRVTLFLYDHKGDTLREVIDRATSLSSRIPLKARVQARQRLCRRARRANEVIARSDKLTLGLMLLAQLIFCAIGFRSLMAGLLFVGVVLMSNTFGMALMAYWNVGLNVKRCRSSASASASARITHLHRVARDRRIPAPRPKRLESALVDGIATAGKAVLYTAFLISASIAFWSFPHSDFKRDGLSVIDHSRHEHARRPTPFTGADRSYETQICQRISVAMNLHFGYPALRPLHPSRR